MAPKEGTQRTLMALLEPLASRVTGAAGFVTRPPVPPVNARFEKVAVLAVVFPLHMNKPIFSVEGRSVYRS